jgi:hypothetical protein
VMPNRQPCDCAGPRFFYEPISYLKSRYFEAYQVPS